MLSPRPNRFDLIECHLGRMVAGHLSVALESVFSKQEKSEFCQFSEPGLAPESVA